MPTAPPQTAIGGLLDDPSLSRVEELLEISFSSRAAYRGVLGGFQLVMHRPIDRAEHTDRSGKVGWNELSEEEGERGVRLLVPNQDIFLGDAILAKDNHLGLEADEPNPFVLRLAEEERFSVLHAQLHVVLDGFLVTLKNAPSLKTLQFWKISTNAEPLCCAIRCSTP